MKAQKLLFGLSFCNLLIGLFAFVCMTSMTSCDDHEPVDTGIHPGYLLLTDHTVTSEHDYYNLPGNSRSSVVGVVFATATPSHPALAVMLNEFEGKYCDYLVSCGASTVDSVYNGRTNTISMLDAKEDSITDICPLALEMQQSHKNGQSEFLPSVAEMRLLVASLSVVNPVLTRFGGTPVCVDPARDCWYWTSTESASSQTRYAWLCSAVNGGILETTKTESHKARAIIELNYPSN